MLAMGYLIGSSSKVCMIGRALSTVRYRIEGDRYGFLQFVKFS